MSGRLMCACILIMSLCACRKELCYTHDDHSPGVRINLMTDWELEWERDYGRGWRNCWDQSWDFAYEDLCPDVPEGIRLIAYHEAGGYKEFNIEPYGRKVVLGEEGEYRFLMYNNDTEYVVYSDLSSSEDATATTRTTSRAEFRSPVEGERVMNQPDMLFGRYVENCEVERKIETETIALDMRPLVYSYYVRLGFVSGYEYVSMARGVFAGMAEKVYLYDGHTGPESASIMFSCEKAETYLYAKVMTFGIPDYPGDHYSKGDEEGKYIIRLEVLMINGAYKAFDIDVSDQMNNQPRGGVILVDGLEITEDEGRIPDVGEGGFGVGVGDWENPIEIPLPLK